FGRDADIARQSELEAAAEGEAADGRDDGLRAALHLRAEVEPLARFAEVRRGRRLEELADVRARAESPLPRPRDDHDLDRVVRAEAREDVEELRAHGVVHGVEHVGTVESEGENAVLRLRANGLVGSHLSPRLTTLVPAATRQCLGSNIRDPSPR